MANEPKFTQGKWILGKTWRMGWYRDVFDSAGNLVLTLMRHSSRRFNRDNNENEANAHLIAAAPDLYAALELLMDWFGDFDQKKHPTIQNGNQVWEIVEDALRKARGEQP